ncbi:MAG: uracil-DNA glycosylase [Firmicutes bacterium]|nr:uracil-DNA glycosylase [Bacillota bacterium]
MRIKQLRLFTTDPEHVDDRHEKTPSRSKAILESSLDTSSTDQVPRTLNDVRGTVHPPPTANDETPGLWATEPSRCTLPTLDAISRAVAECSACGLCKTRNKTVPGEGSANARLIFVGEGPGREEDAQGLPFVGAAGRLLDKLLLSMELKRSDVFIGNVVKCRPPRNRDPRPEETEACMPFLARQIELIKPDVMVILGATALRALVDAKARITAARGKWIRRSGIMIMPTFHPAALLRDPSRKILVWEDMKKVLHFLNNTPQ